MIYTSLSKQEAEGLPIFQLKGRGLFGQVVSKEALLEELESRTQEDDSERIHDFCAQSNASAEVRDLVACFLKEILRARKSVCSFEASSERFFVYVFNQRKDANREGISSLLFDDRPVLGSFSAKFEAIQKNWNRFGERGFHLVDASQKEPVSLAFGRINKGDNSFVCEYRFKPAWLEIPPRELRGRGAEDIKVHPLVPLHWLSASMNSTTFSLNLSAYETNIVFGGKNMIVDYPPLNEIDEISREQFLTIFAQALMHREEANFSESVAEIIRSF